MHIEIRTYADGWAWYLIDGMEIVASSKPFITRHAAVASAQRLMFNGIDRVSEGGREIK